MIGAKPYSTATASGSKSSLHDGTALPHATEYRQIVGALQYYTLTRPDIAFSVNQLCQFLHSPTSTHWTAAKRVLRYLKGTITHGLFFSKGSLSLQAFCDSDWASSPNDRWCTTGFGIFLGSCLVSWSAKMQYVVATLAQRLSTAPWLSPLLTYIGYACYSKTFKFLCLLCRCYGVTMLVLLPSPLIRSSMLAPNTLKSTITSFAKKLLTVTCL
jgi:hypothetical protein